MSKADVVILVGARLNWLLSFGRDKWNPDARFVQLDVEPQEIDVNRPIAAPVVGDLGASIEALTAALSSLKLNVAADWLSSLRTEAAGKREALVARLNEAAPLVPMTHWSALSAIKPVLETNPDVVLINEGANTLDDTRNAVDMSQPRSRIDCATWAIMGMGMGSAVGAAVATGRRVVAIEGDSAFGFSGIDFSTVCRYRLPVTVVVFNNGGIYNGVGQPLVATDDPAPTTLDINARYDRMGEVFGAASYDVATADHLSAALTEALASRRPAIINVRLAADSGQESGHIGYLNPTPLQLIKV
jgi:oxalyl-CoA decarboxylase